MGGIFTAMAPAPKKNHVIHKFTEGEADRKRCQPSSSVHLFNKRACCGKRATWSLVEVSTRGAIYAVNLYDRAPSLAVSVWRHRQHTNTHADLFLVTFVHVGADTPHILQTHVSPTVQILPRRQIHCP